MTNQNDTPLSSCDEENLETHQFTVSNHIITHLVKSQAGTLGKGILEAVANSLDSGSLRVDIEITPTTLVIADDGCGIANRMDIIRVFGQFGFVHDDKSRAHGQFGMGRSQLWNFAQTRWRTRTFSLDVDIRNKGLNYDLAYHDEDQPGLRIEGTFYDALSHVELNEVTRELELLCRYATLEVSLNGKIINKAPVDEKWTRETDDFWLRTADTKTLKVYSQGFFVREYNASMMGVGGVLVSKSASPFKVNFARNDILQQECSLWKKVRVLCNELSGEKTKKTSTTRLSDEDRDFLAAQTADASHVANFNLPLFSLTNGRHMSLKQMAKWKVFLSVAEKGNRVAETIIRDGHGVVLTEQTLARFGASTVYEFKSILLHRLNLNRVGLGNLWQASRLLADTEVYEDLAQAPAFKQLQSSCIPSSELTPTQKAIVNALNAADSYVRRAVCTTHPSRQDGLPLKLREIRIGRSTHSSAWTDAETYIAFADHVVEKAAKDGLQGFGQLVHLLLHEYLHDSEDSGSHAHDPDFYEAFHEISVFGAGCMMEACVVAFRTFCARQERLNVSLSKSLDRIAAATLARTG